MSRLALSLLLLMAMAPTAQAEGKRSLGVTVSPLGAYAVTRMHDGGVLTGLSGGIDWDYRKDAAWTSMGGHVASSALFTEATPLRVRVGPRWGRLHPYIGAGMSLLLAHDPSAQPRASVLRLGAEASAGASVRITPAVYMAAEGRYQNFSLQADPLSSARQELFSAYLGVGFRL